VLTSSPAASKCPSQTALARLMAFDSAHSLVGHTIEEVECELVICTLRYYSGNRTRSARVLGISVRTLRNRINEYAGKGIAVPEPSSAREDRNIFGYDRPSHPQHCPTEMA
jgi:two-component system response regulator FlrC